MFRSIKKRLKTSKESAAHKIQNWYREKKQTLHVRTDKRQAPDKNSDFTLLRGDSKTRPGNQRQEERIYWAPEPSNGSNTSQISRDGSFSPSAADRRRSSAPTTVPSTAALAVSQSFHRHHLSACDFDSSDLLIEFDDPPPVRTDLSFSNKARTAGDEVTNGHPKADAESSGKGGEEQLSNDPEEEIRMRCRKKLNWEVMMHSPPPFASTSTSTSLPPSGRPASGSASDSPVSPAPPRVSLSRPSGTPSGLEPLPNPSSIPSVPLPRQSTNSSFRHGSTVGRDRKSPVITLSDISYRRHSEEKRNSPLSGGVSDVHNISSSSIRSIGGASGPDSGRLVQFSDFEQISLLGDGDNGKVYLMRLLGTDKLFAMKTINKKKALEDKKVHRIMTEREILSIADHPFIITLEVAFQTTADVCFVMEYCRGGELFSMLQQQQHKSLNESEAQFYAAEVLLALEYVHMLGFVYRDLKPENIMLSENGHIKLIDFDLSKRAAEAKTAQFIRPRTLTGRAPRSQSLVDIQPRERFTSKVGTAGYAAPEILNEVGHTSSVDWWTFGVLLYEMLYGRLPFTGNQFQQLQQIMAGNMFFPEYPVISADAKHLIKKLLSSNPKKRLGHKHGAAEIKQHPFFHSINWALIRHQEAPIKPKLAPLPLRARISSSASMPPSGTSTPFHPTTRTGAPGRRFLNPFLAPLGPTPLGTGSPGLSRNSSGDYWTIAGTDFDEEVVAAGAGSLANANGISYSEVISMPNGSVGHHSSISGTTSGIGTHNYHSASAQSLMQNSSESPKDPFEGFDVPRLLSDLMGDGPSHRRSRSSGF
mmetsp:Transcript_37046/g.59996  ORF Transcript_37046/g.59996 Transcript_37046/m.59996 type:complete len:816 (+) Transcript_37046:68-2515(+)